MIRPVKRHSDAVNVQVILVIHAILDVIWTNHFTKWNKTNNCKIDEIKVPTETLWKPDIIIAEMIERSNNPPSPYLRMFHDGYVESRTEEVIVSTCKMRIYKFPFDTQSCNLTFKSIVYSSDELCILPPYNDEWLTNQSRKAMKAQYEWRFVNITFDKRTVRLINLKQYRIVFTITMERKAVLYIANFLLPILFFLCLDLASFLISDTGGEKLGFKITVLLAVTVMQLLLNDILPSSSNRIPLIAIFCIGIFSLMLLSVLETILVMNLIDRDDSSQEKKTDEEQNLKKKRGARSSKLKESSTLESVLDELEDVKNMMTLLRDGKEEEQEGYWTKMAKRINKIFMMFYFPAVTVFLIVIFSMWNSNYDPDFES
ncbi:5-hydroxytryptamine receptor 3B-like [Kryptolebias marmoratus]|uniref:5-hydroxytryptamine receptor 3B-like n=1 Tax=Kryptolebias marmoratus TaxID=37003 RepID=UPI0018AD0DBA|nr:5-hydroxytryptamine receptor 3B-like [Kryptolebias marmoratus]